MTDFPTQAAAMFCFRARVTRPEPRLVVVTIEEPFQLIVDASLRPPTLQIDSEILSLALLELAGSDTGANALLEAWQERWETDEPEPAYTRWRFATFGWAKSGFRMTDGRTFMVQGPDHDWGFDGFGDFCLTDDLD